MCPNEGNLPIHHDLPPGNKLNQLVDYCTYRTLLVHEDEPAHGQSFPDSVLCKLTHGALIVGHYNPVIVCGPLQDDRVRCLAQTYVSHIDRINAGKMPPKLHQYFRVRIFVG